MHHVKTFMLMYATLWKPLKRLAKGRERKTVKDEVTTLELRSSPPEHNWAGTKWPLERDGADGSPGTC